LTLSKHRNPIAYLSIQDVNVVSFSLDESTGWINRRKPDDIWRQVCWLPKERRDWAQLAFHGQKVAVGSDAGIMTILDFSHVE
jgi:hypothetical protein